MEALRKRNQSAKKGRDAENAAASRYGVPASMSRLAEDKVFRDKFLGRALGANNLLDHDVG